MVNQAIERAKTISEELREQIQHDLTKAIRGDVKFDRYTRAIYATDASIYEMEPVGLVLPRNAADVARSIEIIKTDILRTMKLLGCDSVSQLDGSFVTIPDSWKCY